MHHVIKQFLHHAFIPSEHNNHRAKLLHNQSLFVLVIIFFLLSLVVFPVKKNYPQVLGDSISISAQELLQLTNSEREDRGLSALTLDSQLAKAAELKADYMFEKNYWSHIAPDGTTPWVFIKRAGYDYVYAGENLARGFTSSSDVVNAWMASPTHRENILSPKYQDIGFAIREGNLLSENTILVVEMFGSKTVVSDSKTTPPQQSEPITNESSNKVLSVAKNPMVNSFSFSKFLDIGIIGLFILVLIIDMVIIVKKKVIRVVGHNIDHILFFSAVFLFMILLMKGSIL